MTISARRRAVRTLAAATGAALALASCTTDAGYPGTAPTRAHSGASAGESASTGAGATGSPGGASASATPVGAETPERAAALVAALVTAQAAAVTATDAEGPAKRAAVYADHALAAAEAQVKLVPSLSAAEKADLPLQPGGAVVLAVSRGPAYPRTIIAAANRAGTSTPALLLAQAKEGTAYRIVAQAPLLPGASVGQFETAAVGSPPLTGASLAVAPDALLAAYAAALAYPKPAAATQPFAADPFATALTTGEGGQARALGRSATLKSTHTPVAVLGGLRMAPGKGALVVGVIERRDVLTESTPGSLTATKAFSILSGKNVITAKAELTSLEFVAFLVPESGPAQAVAADDQLIAASGS